MYCPYCSHAETKVLESRILDSSMRRRRKCLSCSNRFTTYEQAHLSLKVIKRDGREEEYNFQKLSGSIQKACAKINSESLALLSQKVQQKILNKKSTALPSSQIGKIILKELKKYDPMAYVRFASVHKKINDPRSLEQELQAIRKTSGVVTKK